MATVRSVAKTKSPLNGRVAIVVIGSPGLGSARLATALAKAGATVVIAGDNPEQAGEALTAIEASGRGRGAFFAMAPDDPDDTDALVEFVAEQFRDRSIKYLKPETTTPGELLLST